MMTRTVPKFKLEFDDGFVNRFAFQCGAILQGDALQEDFWVRKFEADFAKFIDAPHCVATSSGTTALECALRAVGVAGKEVIVPTNTFIATAIAVERAGGILKLVDIEPETFAIDPDALASQINEKTGAVVLVHIGGVISKAVEDIVEICALNSVPLVEDAAHAHASCRGKFKAGSIGMVAAFSFFPTKILTCAEGGMVTTTSESIAERARRIKNFGRINSDGLLAYFDGMNAKMTEFQGLLGVMDLGRLQERSVRRMVLSGLYGEYLEGTGFLPVQGAWACGSHYKEILTTRIDTMRLKEYCSERGVDLAGEVYRFPLHHQPVFEGRFGNDFPVANNFCHHHICPPLYPEMEVEDVEYVCEVLKAAEKEL